MDGDFVGKVALITGSSRNLGVTIAQTLSERGAIVGIHYSRRADEALGAMETIGTEGGSVEVFGADLARQGGAEQLAADVITRLGRVDILVNNVGPYADIPFLSLPVHDWDRVMNSGLRACYLLVQALAPGMKDRTWGRIVNISAVSAFIRVHSVYGLMKSALLHLTEELALELAPDIRVNAIAPGQIQESVEVAKIDPTYIPRMIDGTPLHRLVTRREVAEAVCLLCSDLLPSMTGQTIVLDGGWSIPVGRETPVLNASV